MIRIAITATVAVLVVLAPAATSTAGGTSAHAGAAESGQPVIDWNRTLLSIVRTPSRRPRSVRGHLGGAAGRHEDVRKRFGARGRGGRPEPHLRGDPHPARPRRRIRARACRGG
jgi:hypothetical protein